MHTYAKNHMHKYMHKYLNFAQKCIFKICINMHLYAHICILCLNMQTLNHENICKLNMQQCAKKSKTMQKCVVAPQVWISMYPLHWAAEDLGQPLPWASRGHVTTLSMSPQRLRSPIITFATKKSSTGSNRQMEDAASQPSLPLCLCSFDWAVKPFLSCMRV